MNIIKKIRDKFENISRLSEVMLILGHLFILFLLLGSLAYMIFHLYISDSTENTRSISDLMLLGTLTRENAIAALGIVWAGSLLADCLAKEKNLD